MTIRVLSFGFDSYNPRPGYFVPDHKSFFTEIKEKNKNFSKSYILNGSLDELSLDESKGVARKKSFESIEGISLFLNTPLDPFLLADVFGNLKAGDSYRNAGAELYKGNYDWKIDETKITILYAQMHKIAEENPGEKITFDFYDSSNYGKSEVLEELRTFYTIYPNLIPNNLTLRLHSYDSLHKHTVPLLKITGTGITDKNYRQTVLDWATQTEKCLPARGGDPLNARISAIQQIKPECLTEETRARISFFAKLKKITEKADELKRRGEGLAAKAAYALYKSFSDALVDFNHEGVSKFSEATDRAIQTASNSELKNHRAYLKQILTYAGLAVLAILSVVTFGAAYAVAGGINYAVNGRFFIPTTIKTDSINQVDELKEATDAMKRLSGKPSDLAFQKIDTLIAAIKKDSIELAHAAVAALNQDGISLNALGCQDSGERVSPLFAAIRLKNLRMIKLLLELEKEASLDELIETTFGSSKSALYEMIKTEQDFDELSKLIPNFNYNRIDKAGKSLLDYAIEAGNTSLISKLIEKEAEVNPPGQEHTPLDTLIEIVKNPPENLDEAKIISVCDAIVSQSSFNNRIDKAGKSLLDYAIEAGNTSLISKLIEKGADVNPPGQEHTPLDTLIEIVKNPPENLDEAKIISVCDAIVSQPGFNNLIDKAGKSLLDYAIEAGNTSLISKLIEKGADVNPPGQEHTPLDTLIEIVKNPPKNLDEAKIISVYNAIVSQPAFTLAKEKHADVLHRLLIGAFVRGYTRLFALLLEKAEPAILNRVIPGNKTGQTILHVVLDNVDNVDNESDKNAVLDDKSDKNTIFFIESQSEKRFKNYNYKKNIECFLTPLLKKAVRIDIPDQKDETVLEKVHKLNQPNITDIFKRHCTSFTESPPSPQIK